MNFSNPHRRSRASRAPYVCLSILLALTASRAMAQGPVGAGAGKQQLPDSPQPKPESIADVPMEATTKFVGYMTRTSLFFPEIAASPYPLSTKKKFELFVNRSISPAVILVSATSAAIGQARDVPPEFGQGAEGYGKRFGSSLARGASNNFFGTFVLASALHQDPRFFPRSNPSLWSTMKYAARTLVITRTDAGTETFNTSGLAGPLLGEGLANVYLPPSEQTVGKLFSRYGTDLAWTFAGNVLREYWPTIFKSMGLKNLKIMPTPAPVQTVAPTPAPSTPQN